MSTKSEREMGERIINSLTESIIELDELIKREYIEREQMDRSSDDFEIRTQ